MNNSDLEVIARKRVRRKMGFYIHAIVFILVVTFLVVINIILGGHFWSLLIVLFWGLGLAIHGLTSSTMAYDFKRRMIEKEIQNIKQ